MRNNLARGWRKCANYATKRLRKSPERWQRRLRRCSLYNPPGVLRKVRRHHHDQRVRLRASRSELVCPSTFCPTFPILFLSKWSKGLVFVGWSSDHRSVPIQEGRNQTHIMYGCLRGVFLKVPLPWLWALPSISALECWRTGAVAQDLVLGPALALGWGWQQRWKRPLSAQEMPD